MTKRWTEAEHALFLALYPVGGPTVVAAVTGRPVGSIKVRASNLQLKTIYAHPREKRQRLFSDEHVIGVLEQCGWVAKAAAAKLGIHTSTVWAAERRLNEKRKSEIRARNEARHREISAYLEEVFA